MCTILQHCVCIYVSALCLCWLQTPQCCCTYCDPNSRKQTHGKWVPETEQQLAPLNVDQLEIKRALLSSLPKMLCPRPLNHSSEDLGFCKPPSPCPSPRTWHGARIKSCKSLVFWQDMQSATNNLWHTLLDPAYIITCTNNCWHLLLLVCC